MCTSLLVLDPNSLHQLRVANTGELERVTESQNGCIWGGGREYKDQEEG